MFKNLKDADIKKVRIITFSLVVISFVMALVLLKLGAKYLGLDKGEYMPLLELSKKEYPLVKGDNIKLINKYLGKPVVLEDTIKEIDKSNNQYVLKLTYASILINKKLNLSVGDKIRACGKLDIHPLYGLELQLLPNCSIKVISKSSK